MDPIFDPKMGSFLTHFNGLYRPSIGPIGALSGAVPPRTPPPQTAWADCGPDLPRRRAAQRRGAVPRCVGFRSENGRRQAVRSVRARRAVRGRTSRSRICRGSRSTAESLLRSFGCFRATTCRRRLLGRTCFYFRRCGRQRSWGKCSMSTMHVEGSFSATR